MSGLFFSCLPANFLHPSFHLPIHLSILQYAPLIDKEKSAPRINHWLVKRPSNAQEVGEYRINYTLQFGVLCILKLHVMLSSDNLVNPLTTAVEGPDIKEAVAITWCPCTVLDLVKHQHLVFIRQPAVVIFESWLILRNIMSYFTETELFWWSVCTYWPCSTN